MRKTSSVLVLIFALVATQVGLVFAASDRTTPDIEQTMTAAQAAIDAGENIHAVQLLTKLANLPAHVYSERAQEMLGKVRESNGQLAQALAEYRAYLAKYPDGEGANRVRARVRALEATGPQSPARVPRSGGETATASAGGTSSTAQAAQPRRQPARVKTRRQSTYVPPPPLPTVAAFGDRYTVRDRGRVALTYRYNELASQFTDLTPDPDELEDKEYYFANAMTASLWFDRTYENDQRRVRLTFSGSADIDLDDFGDSGTRIYEASIGFEDKQSGRMITFGRQRLKPSGIVYRTDGISAIFVMSNGPELGFFAGTVVNSTRDPLFGSGEFLFGASAKWENVGGQGDLTLYAVEQRYQSRTDRRALGIQYDRRFKKGALRANAEYDIKLGAINRAQVSGSIVLANDARLTGRLSYFHSPSLRMRNALIGQTATSLDQLATDLFLTESELQQTAAVTYYKKLNDKWNVSADATLYYTGGTPASGGVGAVPADGLRTYFGVNFYGSSIFRDRDQINFGLRGSTSDDSNLFVVDGGIRLPVTDTLTIRPRVQLGYRSYSGGMGDERFIVPSVRAEYKLNKQSSIQVDVGSRWSERREPSSVTTRQQLFLTAGVYRSF